MMLRITLKYRLYLGWEPRQVNADISQDLVQPSCPAPGHQHHAQGQHRLGPHRCSFCQSTSKKAQREKIDIVKAPGPGLTL